MTDDLYVVIEWNQASGQPRLFFDDLYDKEVDALEDARHVYDESRQNGRRETYSVGQITDWTDVADIDAVDSASSSAAVTGEDPS